LGRDAGGTDQTAALDAIDVDIDNYRAAFAHLPSVGQVNEAARGIIALDVYWQIRRTREGLPWYQQLIAHSDLDPRWRPRALAQAAQTEANIGDFFAAERDATEAVELTDALGIAAPLPALQALMLIASCREDHEADRAWYERAHEVAVASGQPYLRLLIEAQRRPIPGVEDIAETVEHCERLLPDIEAQGSPLLASLAALQFAVCLYDDGQIERASAVLISAVESARRSGPIMIAAILGSAAAFNILTGKLDHARAPAAEALRLARDEGLTMAALDCIVVVAALAARQGEIDTAATLLAGGSRYGDALGSRGFYAPCRAEATSTVEAHTGDLGAARGLGTRMTFEDLANLALATLGDPLTSRAGE
jgi:tetratricopeptide (TPR) repeat protein